MGHRTVKTGYQQLAQRLNRFPQGAPPTESLFAVLSVLMKEKEAEILSKLPIKPFSVSTAAKALRVQKDEAAKVMENLASRALLVDIVQPDGEMLYVLPPPMAGFFEFSLMRVRSDINQKVLSELFYQYLNVEEDFIRDLFVQGETKLGRVFVQEQALDDQQRLHILDYERSSSMIQHASRLGVGMCYCRHKMDHLGKACNAPMDICMTLGNAADSLIRHGHAREISVSEAMELLDTAYENNLVQIGENQQKNIPFICNCCGCCCEALLAVKQFGTLYAINTSNYLPSVNQEICTGCGACIPLCPVQAVSLDGKSAAVDEEACLGCGVCVRGCPVNALSLYEREQRVITPVHSVHRIVCMAVERGTLQNLIFDNQAHLSHRALAALLGAVLKLPPVKRKLASQQFKSRYLLKLMDMVPNKIP